MDALKTEFPVKAFRLLKGDQFDFKFNAVSKSWVTGNIRRLDPASSGARITTESARLTRYAMYDGNWLPELFMPATANDGDLVAIHSDATWTAKVSPFKLLFASFSPKTGDTYVFSFRGDLRKWIPETMPVRTMPVAGTLARMAIGSARSLCPPLLAT